MSKNFFKKIGIGFGAFLLPALAAAENLPTGRSATEILTSVSTWMSGIVGALALVMLLYAAFLFVVGGASADSQTKAKTALIYVIVGIVVALLAYSVGPLVKAILGV